MNFIESSKKSALYLLLLIIILNSVSCSKEIPKDITPTPKNPLYDSFDIKTTSLQCGNLYYKNFLTTDGSLLYFQADDGKTLMKSDYNGNNSKVISNRFPSFINVVENMVYFIEGGTSGKIYKIDTEGKGETMVLDLNAKSLIATPEYLFFINTKDGFVYFSLHDGSKKTLLLDKITSQIQLSNEKLYIQIADEAKGVFIISLDNLSKLNNSLLDTTGSSESSVSSSAMIDNSTANTSETATSGIIATPTVSAEKPIVEIQLTVLTESNSQFKSINIENNKFFFIDPKNNSYIVTSENKKHKTFLKKSIVSPFIISGQFIYYINPDDESRLYRVSTSDSSDNAMVVNDRVDQFVICGNSIYYRRENNLEIFRTPVEGGVSTKIT